MRASTLPKANLSIMKEDLKSFNIEKEIKRKEVHLEDENYRYTYADLLAWDDEVRYELHDGILYLLAAPLHIHQIILVELTSILHQFLKGKKCRLFVAPSDVRLNFDTKDNDVYQPDLFVVCDKSKLEDKRTCKGAPDLVIEILSPSTAHIDRFVKYQSYQKYGVREYWIVNPETKKIDVYFLEDGKFIPTVFGEDDVLPSKVIDGLCVKLSDVFESE